MSFLGKFNISTDKILKNTDKLYIIAGTVFSALSAVFFVVILIQIFGISTRIDYGSKSIFSLGAMLFNVYGYTSILIPIFFITASLLCFLRKANFKTSFILASSVIPFFTIAVTENICKTVFANANDFFFLPKIIFAIVVSAMLVATEFVGALILYKKIYAKINGVQKKNILGERKTQKDSKIKFLSSIEKNIENIKAANANAEKIEKKIAHEKNSNYELTSKLNAILQNTEKASERAEKYKSYKDSLVAKETIFADAVTYAYMRDKMNSGLYDENDDPGSGIVVGNKVFENYVPSGIGDQILTNIDAVKENKFSLDDYTENTADETVADDVSFTTNQSDDQDTKNLENHFVDENAEKLECEPVKVESENVIKQPPVENYRKMSYTEYFTLKGYFSDDDKSEDNQDESAERKKVDAYGEFDEPQHIEEESPEAVPPDSAKDVFAQMDEDIRAELSLRTDLATEEKDDTFADETTQADETQFTDDAMLAEETSVTDEAQFADETSEIDDDTVADESQFEEESFTDEVTGENDDTLSAEETFTANESPLADETQFADDAPLADETPFVDETAVADDTELTDDVSLADETTQADETQFSEDESLSDETAFVYENEAPIADDTALAEETSAADETNSSDGELEQKKEERLPPPLSKARAKFRGKYKIDTELLTEYEDDKYWVIDGETEVAAVTLKDTLNEFKIEAEIVGIKKGPVVTMFELLPAPGVKLSRVVALQDNIALRLAASSVRIVAPIPGKRAVGIEIPNQHRSIVGFREIIEMKLDEYKKMAVPVILGKDILGKPQIIDLVKTPHLLIAGATGAGKSVCVNSMILSILYKRSPNEVRMIMIDPKIVELKLYNDIPHLLTPVITEPKRAFQSLQYCLAEMERRYSLLDAMGVRDLSSYNKRIEERKIATEKLPYIIVIIDEFADLMATTGKELEQTLARLAAMSRAVGIHLVLATQRPSIDVITGLIKANIPSRIAFMVASKMDSRIIIDQVGAEKLLGKGDMLYASATDPFPIRIQGTFVSDNEVENVVNAVKEYGEPDYIDDEIFIDEDDDASGELSLFDGGEDPLYSQALDIVLQAGKASASYIQRRLKIGYNRAARLVEEMEMRGIVGPANGSKPREVIHIP